MIGNVDRASHPAVELLQRAIDGRLTPEESCAVEQHVVECDVCRERMEQMTPAGGAPDARGSRHLALRARVRDGVARLVAEHDAAPAEPAANLAWALALMVLAIAVLVPGGQQILIDNLNAAPVFTRARPAALPVPALTPGAVQRMTVAELCAGRRPVDRSVSPLVRLAVLRAYQMEAVPAQEYELDYLITPELGGAATRQNLWPERYASRVWNAHVKDQLEALLPRMVCEGRLELAVAQRDLAADWIAAYRKYFRTDTPLPQQVAALDDDDVVQAAAQPHILLAQLTWRSR